MGYAGTGVSRLPSLRPVVLWGKGDCWAGGGLFEDDYHLWVNQQPNEASRSLVAAADRGEAEARSIFALTFNPEPRGEDEPVYGRRLSRDGWRVEQERVVQFDGHRGYTTPVPEIRSKGSARSPLLRMTRSLDGFRAVESYEVVLGNGATIPLAGADWADWDHRDRLVFARRGRLHAGDLRADGLEEREIADLNPLVPPSHD